MGCFKVSQGCKHCYAEEMTSVRMRIDVFGHDTAKRRRTQPKTWANPVKWHGTAHFDSVTGRGLGRPHRVFCASLADVFEDAPGPNEWRRDVWRLVHATPWLDWQILTKRPENVMRMLPDDWADNQWGYWPNVWLGTSIEDNRVAERSTILAGVPARVHFISYEPAIGPGDGIPLEGIEWLICGGESGPSWEERQMDLSWAFEMWSRCEMAGVPFFFKQISARKTEMGIDALGEIVREYPVSWDRREMRRAA